LIIVHKEFLMTQWIERIKQFVPSARIGIIQGSKVDVAHKDVVIGMLQSLSKKDYDRNIFKDFGLTIIDETHHVCTRSFSKALLNYNTKYILGLSATLERKDGLTKVLHWFIGPVLYQAFRERKHDVVVEKHAYTCSMFENEFPVNRAKKANLPLAINELTENQDRNTLLQNIIKECVLRHGRKVLVLTDRRQHCITLVNGCSYTTCGLYLGGMKPHDLAESEKCNVIFGTFSLAHEGLDIPELDTLILASPKSDIVQSVGRILRETPGKKNHPLVVDIADNWGPFKGQYYKRQKYYKSTGFTIIQKGAVEEEQPLDIGFVED
jgi:superfamily II DNA or RNA helicase